MTFTRRHGPGHTTSFADGVRAIAGASLLAAIGFPAVVLAAVAPLVLLVGTLRYGLTELTRYAGMTSAFVESAVGLTSFAGGVLLFAWIARSLLRSWRRYDRAREGRRTRYRAVRALPQFVTDQLTNVRGPRRLDACAKPSCS